MAYPDNLADLARAFLGDSANQNLASPGHVVFPNGLIINWGTMPTTASGATATISFSKPFPTTMYVALATPSTVAGATPLALGIDAGTTLSAIKINNHSAVTQGGFWIAVGK